MGYKAHVGVDRDSSLIHTVKVTAANVHDVNVTAELLTGEEETVHGDSDYIGCEKRSEDITRNKARKQIRYKINRKPSFSKHNSLIQKIKSNVESVKNLQSALKLNTFSLL